MAYAKPDDITLLVLQTFADWQAPCWDAPLAATAISDVRGYSPRPRSNVEAPGTPAALGDPRIVAHEVHLREGLGGSESPRAQGCHPEGSGQRSPKS